MNKWKGTILFSAVLLSGLQLQAQAVRPGFNSNTLGPCLDCSSPSVSMGFPINFFGVTYSSLFVNSHGNVTFDFARPANFVPEVLAGSGTKIIAPFFADNDMNANHTAVTYG